MKFLKKQGLGAWISVAAVIVSIVAFVIYSVAIKSGDGLLIASGSEPFYDSSLKDYSEMTTGVGVSAIIAIVLLVGALVAAQFQFEGIVGKVVDVVVGVVRVVAPALLMVALLYFVYGSLTGLGWTFFSNEELQIYAKAIALGKQVIVGLVFFAVAMVASIVAAFFDLTKEEA